MSARVAGLMAIIVLGTLVAPAHANHGKVWHPAGSWRFDESADARTARDSTRNNLDGDVGSDVRTGVDFGKRTGYRFPGVSSSPPSRPEHLVVVPDHALLDPGATRYKVAIRIRTTQASGNIIQKGQSRTYGGFWKIETHAGVASCLFRAGDRSQSGVGSGKRVDDGRWHTIVCTRTAKKTVMRVDGVVTDTRWKGTGTITNNKPVTIGGKGECDQVDVGCDYFVGDIDFVRIAT